MNYFISSRMMVASLFVTTTLVVCFLLLDGKSIVNAQVVDIDEPPTNVTEELDVKVDATEPLPLNGTIIVDITEADDIDIDSIPPQGVSIVVTNNTLTVTNSPVEIQEQDETSDTEEAATGTSDVNNENEVDGSGGNENGEEASSDIDITDENEDEGDEQ